MKEQEKDIPRKKPYEKPHIEEVELFADEVLGLSCKITTESAPGISVCIAGGCHGPGS